VTLWTQMSAGLFDTSPAPVQDSLFPLPDPCGTQDMADLIDQD
jgi:hypothetical protein